jgi:inosine-uridine nucleoside N-ribohydrolase
MSSPVLVDTDPGIDDALALHYLVATGGWELKAITAVAGNVPLPRTVANARGLAALLGIERDVPLYGGCPKPLMSDLDTAQHVHGDDGMAVIAGVAERREHAVQVINEFGRRYSGELIMVAIGPLNNVAVVADPGWVKLGTGNLYVETQGEHTRGKMAFLSHALRQKSPGLDPQLALGQVALGPRRLRGTFRRHAGCAGNATMRRSLHGRLYPSG